ncbi:hypothetical protein PFISCL1PPCAC_13998 [Pristionchus fissidentatus]|uniref:Secreted protein n=1 Tax=Pristionchus fissidentatus TaxID=1538716 RepID=A0AAV5VVY5_9BILA|nr:hypothetical protein PFISCL1PPCAC_13998 [Pristionchus fissidentatus]
MRKRAHCMFFVCAEIILLRRSSRAIDILVVSDLHRSCCRVQTEFDSQHSFNGLTGDIRCCVKIERDAILRHRPKSVEEIVVDDDDYDRNGSAPRTQNSHVVVQFAFSF